MNWTLIFHINVITYHVHIVLFKICYEQWYEFSLRSMRFLGYCRSSAANVYQNIWIVYFFGLPIKIYARVAFIPYIFNQFIYFFFDVTAKCQRISIRNIETIAKRSFECQSFCYAQIAIRSSQIYEKIYKFVVKGTTVGLVELKIGPKNDNWNFDHKFVFSYFFWTKGLSFIDPVR